MSDVNEVRAVLGAHGGVATTAQLAALGVTPVQLRSLLAADVLVRIRRSSFVDGARWREASHWDRHELRARAVALVLCAPASPYALSHHSALAVLGIGVYDVDDRVHLVRTDGRRGRSGKVVHVHPPVLPRWVAERDGIPVVVPELACLQVGVASGVVSGLVSADSALRVGATDPPGLERARPCIVGPRSPRADVILEHATGLSDSGGETRCRWIMHTVGLPAPELQVPVRDKAGDLVGIVDFLFREHWTIVEFDGALKYSGRVDLVAEKRREDRLRELGYEIVRITWSDLAQPERVLAKIRAAFSRARVRRRPVA
ncbi:type IV toxin-antitoxin system AbiEi family antitoxin domain-containing protein [Ornithinimicrobium cerasi]|uniref:type IV toxin-antitoxin system AbiEi family antitoxin domain-containing protein n=1 Tax=Ornithinimicrobium cerasi TaxID=2248773 RepID=UPI00137B5FAF|nr:type IV toxin-antitoxin system AbiEi family antitoxin domain-containing protein [Ornithinimicrobium cerasi]